jgi:hypothetical protein
MMDDVILLSLVAALSIVAVELRTGAGFQPPLEPATWSEYAVDQRIEAASCTRDDKLEARIEHRVD